MQHYKYHNTKAVHNGITLDSRKEMRRYKELLLLEKAGKIERLTMQPPFVLQEKFSDRHGVKHREIMYIADFSYYVPGDTTRIIEDVKGMRTPMYLLKKKLLLYRYPEIDFREI